MATDSTLLSKVSAMSNAKGIVIDDRNDIFDQLTIETTRPFAYFAMAPWQEHGTRRSEAAGSTAVKSYSTLSTALRLERRSASDALLTSQENGYVDR